MRGAQLGELRRRVAAVEHVEHVLELGARQLGVGVRARDERVERRRPATASSLASPRSRRSAGRARRARCAARRSARSRLAHPLGDDRALEQVAAELREDPALADVSPTPCPARPIRCRPRDTDFGDSTWSTRSTAPMSMPSSSDEVATRHGSSPALSSSSTTVRSSRASEPWWARAISSGLARGGAVGVRKLVQPQREPLGRAAVVDEHDRRAVLADELEQLRVDRRPDRAARRLAAGERVERVADVASGSTIDSTGTWIFRSSGLRTPVSTIRHVRRGPTRKRPISSSGFCVAESPMRWIVAPGARAPGARASARGARRASCRRPRGSRRRSPSATLGERSRAPAR